MIKAIMINLDKPIVDISSDIISLHDILDACNCFLSTLSLLLCVRNERS